MSDDVSLPVIGRFQMKRILLTTAQLLSLNTSPVLLVPAPGSGRMLVFVGAQITCYFGTVPFADEDNGPAICYGSATGQQVDESGIGPVFTTSGSLTVWDEPSGAYFDPALAENNGFVLANVSSDMTGGDGTAAITIFYLECYV